MKKVYVFGLLLLALIGCGVKGDPLPPLPYDPESDEAEKAEKAKNTPVQGGT